MWGFWVCCTVFFVSLRRMPVKVPVGGFRCISAFLLSDYWGVGSFWVRVIWELARGGFLIVFLTVHKVTYALLKPELLTIRTYFPLENQAGHVMIIVRDLFFVFFTPHIHQLVVGYGRMLGTAQPSCFLSSCAGLASCKAKLKSGQTFDVSPLPTSCQFRARARYR